MTKKITATNIRRKIKSGFLIVWTMTSCGVYSPQTIDIPLINKKKDLRIDAGISIKEFAYATVSYGLTDKIALQTFYNKSANDRYFVQGAVGYFKDLGNRNVIELYSGFGYGYTNYYVDPIPASLKGYYQLYFTQFNLGKIGCQFANADLGFGIKAGYLHSNLTDFNYFTRYSGNNGPYETLSDNSFLLEPNVFLRIGGEKLKFSLKLGSCWHYQFTHKDKHLPINEINLGLGLNYRF